MQLLVQALDTMNKAGSIFRDAKKKKKRKTTTKKNKKKKQGNLVSQI